MMSEDRFEDQLHLVQWAQDPDSGRKFFLTFTDELLADFREWVDAACTEHDGVLTRVAIKGGSEQIRMQCIICGEPLGSPVKRSEAGDITRLRVGTTQEQYEYAALRRKQVEQIKLKYFQIQSRPGYGSNEYDDYLLSDEWKAKRNAVIRRASGICEGCGQADAEVVHHLHYDNIYHEWLWDLVALCRPCHSRCHPEHRVGDD